MRLVRVIGLQGLEGVELMELATGNMSYSSPIDGVQQHDHHMQHAPSGVFFSSGSEETGRSTDTGLHLGLKYVLYK